MIGLSIDGVGTQHLEFWDWVIVWFVATVSAPVLVWLATLPLSLLFGGPPYYAFSAVAPFVALFVGFLPAAGLALLGVCCLAGLSRLLDRDLTRLGLVLGALLPPPIMILVLWDDFSPAVDWKALVPLTISFAFGGWVAACLGLRASRA